MLAVMLVVKDQATANANAGKIRELAARLPKDMPHEESVSIMMKCSALPAGNATALWIWKTR